MNEEIAACFASGSLIRPDVNEPDLVHLTRVLAFHAGVERFAPLSNVEQSLLDLIAPTEHVVFVLLDGLGMNLLEGLPDTAFMVRNFKRVIRATFPSTTACALTSIATGEWPTRHAVTGWFTQVPEYGLTMTTLPMVERFSGKPLAERGIKVEELLPVRAFHGEMKVRLLTLLPAPIADTAYARYSRGGTAGMGYGSIGDGIAKVVEHVEADPSPSHTHLYIPDIDTVCHHHGVVSDDAIKAVARVDEELERLSRALNGRARIVISADHGLLDVPPDAHLTLAPGEAILELLEAPPSGDARLPIFHVRSGYAREFALAFTHKFGHAMTLLTTAEAEALELFGPAPMSRTSRGRFGDYVAIARTSCSLHYSTAPTPGGPAHRIYVAQHAGLTPDEINIPLIAA